MTEQIKSPEEIENEIRHTRAEIDQTIDALQEKLSPGQLLDQALGYAKDGGGEFAANLGRTVRDNPVPLLLASTGLAWMMFAGRSRPAHEPPAHEPNDYSRTTAGTMPQEAGSDSAHAAETMKSVPVSSTGAAGPVGQHSSTTPHSTTGESHTGDRMKDKAANLKDTVAGQTEKAGKKLSSAAESVKERTAEWSDDARHMADSTRDRAGQYLHQAREQGARARSAAGQFVHDYPMVVGALGLALGAVIAASLPVTRRENEVLGDKSDQFKRAAQQAGREKIENAKGIAETAFKEGKREADRQNLTPEAAKREAGNVAQAGAEVAKAAGRAGEAKAKESGAKSSRDEDRSHGASSDQASGNPSAADQKISSQTARKA